MSNESYTTSAQRVTNKNPVCSGENDRYPHISHHSINKIASGWDFDVHRGPNWLLVKIKGLVPDASEPPLLADRVWSLLNQHFTYRLVLDIERVDLLNNHLIGQLVMLEKWIRAKGGVLRVCGLSRSQEEMLRGLRLGLAVFGVPGLSGSRFQLLLSNAAKMICGPEVCLEKVLPYRRMIARGK